MAHDQQTAYVKGLIGGGGVRGRFAGKAILELGSFNVNGTVRDLIELPGRYVGVDWRPGPCVDHVSLFHDIPWVGEFDLLISCNAFEHDPHWEKSIEAGLRALKPGGEIILCAAGPGYPPHEVASSPLTDYYTNLGALQFLNVLASHGAQGVLTEFTDPPDLAYHGFKLAESA